MASELKHVVFYHGLSSDSVIRVAPPCKMYLSTAWSSIVVFQSIMPTVNLVLEMMSESVRTISVGCLE